MKEFKLGNFRLIQTGKKDGDGKTKLKEISKKVLKEIFFSSQVHGIEVVKISNFKDSDCDGVFGKVSELKNLAVGIYTADCLPIFIYGKTEFALLHAGWRGLLSGILKIGIEKLGEKGLKAWIGPGISVENYQVKEEFLDNFKKLPKKFSPKINGKRCFDLKLFAKEEFKKAGIEVFDFGVCSFNSADYFSYREGDLKKRNLTLVTSL